MNQAVIVNFFILLVIAGIGAVTKDPLVLLGLFFLVDLPVHVVTNEQQIQAKMLEAGMDEDDDEQEPAIGFTAKL